MARRLKPPSATPARRAAFARVLRGLRKMYGPMPWKPRGPGLDVLVEAMLSQNTNMTNSRRGYRQLRRMFPTWTKVLAAPVQDVQRQIAICGLARQRARRLQVLLQKIKDDHPGGRGKLSLDWLADETTEAGNAYLRSFHGVGSKTAAYTLLFGFNKPVLPVDNGILRVARRLKLVRLKAQADEAEQTLEPLIPRGSHYPAHVLMFRHAKERCRPKNPKCEGCKLLSMCPTGQRRLRHQPPEAGVEVMTPRPKLLARFVSAGIAKQSRDA